MLVLAEGYQDSVCEIKTPDNDFISSGRISSISDEELELVHPEKDRMPLLKYNAHIRISVFNSKLGFKMLTGTVFISTNEFMRVANVRTLQESERRAFFRMRTRLPTKIYVIDKQSGDQVPEPVDVILEDLSLTGVQISATNNFRPNDRMAIEIQLFTKKMLFNCRVIRLTKEKDGRNYYGCVFYDQTERQTDDLCYDLFQLQRMQIRKNNSRK